MIFRMDQLLRSLSMGLDAVESELTGSLSNHGKRIAVLTAAMGKYLGWDDNRIISVSACALLHDNALTESLAENNENTRRAELLVSHCIKGEKNVANLPFPSDTKDFIKYHHEYMDHSGPFGMNAEETPVSAQLIAVADHFDIEYEIKNQTAAELDRLRDAVKQKRVVYYTACAADALLSILDEDLLTSLSDDCIDRSYMQAVPAWNAEVSAEGLMKIAKMTAAITDYKSKFTAKHSAQIANRAYLMAGFYGFDEEARAKIYLAAALHDVGKLVTPVDILEKPGKLNDDEYEIIKKHVYWSYIMLKDIEGFDDICRWAVTHHRKLNGAGYPELPDEYLDMDKVSRLMACIDIYQAVRETRPYHSGRTHRETMDIMWGMVSRGEIDGQITQDLDNEMARFPGVEGDVPIPAMQDEPPVSE